jgi:hypothetical protein
MRQCADVTGQILLVRAEQVHAGCQRLADPSSFNLPTITSTVNYSDGR